MSYIRDNKRILKQFPHSVSDMERLRLDRFLVFIGAIITIILAPILFVCNILIGSVTIFHNLGKGIGIIGGATVDTIISILFGLFLLWIYLRMNRFSRITYILGLIFSLFLIWFGGVSGVLGGLIALIGVIIFLLKVEDVIEKKWPKNK